LACVAKAVTALIWWSTDSAAEHETVAPDPSAPSPVAIDDRLAAARCNCTSLVAKARCPPARNAAVAALPKRHVSRHVVGRQRAVFGGHLS
jgi:hypothetical protein